MLAQDGDLGLGAFALDEGRSDVFVEVEAEFDVQAGILLRAQSVEFCLRAGRVVAQRLHVVAGFRPGLEQTSTFLVKHRHAFAQDAHTVFTVGCADDIELVAQTCCKTRVHHRTGIRPTHLNYCAEFLVEQDAEESAGVRLTRVGRLLHVKHDVFVQTVVA